MKVVSWCAKVPMISPSLTNPQRLPLLSSTGAPEISFSVKSLRASSALAFSLTEKTSVCISEESTLASAALSSFCRLFLLQIDAEGEEKSKNGHNQGEGKTDMRSLGERQC